MAAAVPALAWVAVGLSAVGAGVGAYTAIDSANAAEKAAKFNAAVERNNALAAQQQAKIEAKRIRDRNLRIAARNRSAIFKSGFDLTGSAVDVMYDSAIQGEWDSLIALYTGKVSANAYEARSRITAMEGESAKRAGYLQAGNQILTGLGSAASSYSSYRTSQRQPMIY